MSLTPYAQTSKERDEWRESALALEAEVADLKNRHAKCVEALRAVEWGPEPISRGECAWCLRERPEHDPTCIVTVALAAEDAAAKTEETT